MFPQIKDKKNFLVDLLTSEIPELFPTIFPDAKYFAWVEISLYLAKLRKID